MAGRIDERHAFARAGLLGNPSDGYFGRTLSVVLHNFRATVTLEESPDIRVGPDVPDGELFRDIDDLVASVEHRGHRGGTRLLTAAIKTLSGYCHRHDVVLPTRNFTARSHSSIPRQVGLGGSSAIVTATFRALTDFFEVDIPKEELANLILSAETDELGITAGLQDRVVQVYEGLVYMDFSKRLMEEHGHGAYESLDVGLLPTMFVAYQTQPARESGQVHHDLRVRWDQGDANVRETLAQIAALASAGRDALLAGDHGRFASLMNENFDLRRRIMPIDERDLAMVEAARALGASAKLTGSGGAIIGVYQDDAMNTRLAQQLVALGAEVIDVVTTSRNENR